MSVVLEEKNPRHDVDITNQALRPSAAGTSAFIRTAIRGTSQGTNLSVVGVDLINAASFLMVWPETYIVELAVFIYNEGGPLSY